MANSEAGISESRLQIIDRFFQSRYIDTGRIPGALITIARRGEVVHQSALGSADVERGTPLREDAIFRIYSMTKPITSVAAMMLWEEGQFLLSDPVAKFLPEFAAVRLAGGAAPARAMTVQDLLRHTSGLTYEFRGDDPVHRAYHHDMLTFGLLYAFSENFILPFSHDEVVHQKRSMLDKMPGDEWQRFANLRLLYTYMFTMPGKKLLFMGDEFAHGAEWNDDQPLDWYLLDRPQHQGVQRLVADLNRLHREQRPLHRYDFEGQGFDWIDCHDRQQSLLSYLRRDGDEIAVVALNFTPMPHHNFRLGVPRPGRYEVLFNSDSAYYGGGNLGNAGSVDAEAIPAMGRSWSLSLTLPPLAGIILRFHP